MILVREMWKKSVVKNFKIFFFRQRFWSKRQDTQFSHDNNTPPSGNPLSPPRRPLKRQQRPWVWPIRSIRTPATNVHTNQPPPPIKRSQPHRFVDIQTIERSHQTVHGDTNGGNFEKFQAAWTLAVYWTWKNVWVPKLRRWRWGWAMALCVAYGPWLFRNVMIRSV